VLLFPLPREDEVRSFVVDVADDSDEGDDGGL